MGKQWKQCHFILGGSKTTADGDCSHEIKRCLFLERKAVTNLDSILKSRDITSPSKVHLVTAMVVSVVMYGCESWTMEKAESWRIDAPTVVLEKTLESPLDCKEIQPVHPKGNQPWIAIEGLMLKLKPQYLGHLMWRTDSLERPWCWVRLKAGGEGDDRGWDGWMASPTQWTWIWVNSGSWWWTGRPGVLQSMGLQRVRTRLSNWTELKLPQHQRLLAWGHEESGAQGSTPEAAHETSTSTGLLSTTQTKQGGQIQRRIISKFFGNTNNSKLLNAFIKFTLLVLT